MNKLSSNHVGKVQVNVAFLMQSGEPVEIILPDNNVLAYEPVDTQMTSTAFTLEIMRARIDEFLCYLDVNEDRKPSTITGYRRRLGQFAEWLNKTGKNPTEGEVWRGYYATLKQRRLSPYTRKGHYHILKRFANWLVENNYLRPHPFDDVAAPKLPKGDEPKAISREHIKMMINVAKSPRDRALLLFFRDTGCRAMEALNLVWSDINFEEGSVQVRGKGDKYHPVFFGSSTDTALKKYRESIQCNKGKHAIWWGKKGELTYDGLYKAFKKLAVESGIDEDIFSPHAWRHAFGRDTTRRGIPTAQLQDLMGHSDIKVTKIYAQFDKADLKEAHTRYSPLEDDLDDGE